MQKVLEENQILPKKNLFFLATDIFNTCTADIESAILSPFLQEKDWQKMFMGLTLIE
jgi:hypothetical protein